jgi:hypothetical protein
MSPAHNPLSSMSQGSDVADMSSVPPIRMAVLGFGGLGRGMLAMANARKGFKVTAIADSSAWAYTSDGFTPEMFHQVPCLKALDTTPYQGSVERVNAMHNAMIELLQEHGHELDAVFLAVPNIPVNFYATTLETIANRTPFQGVVVDALKRTSAVETLLPLERLLRSNSILHITGAGATPGFLSTVAAVAAQSFVEVLGVDIWFGVGVSNWEAYRGTIKEDFLHVPGFTHAQVEAMTDADILQALEERNGVLELRNMEHADDIILELTGICPRERVTVGGLVDTRQAKKPCTTTVKVTGRTLAGEVTSHEFHVGDATTMVDNVCGPALGFMNRGVELMRRGIFGLLTSAEVLPRYRAMPWAPEYSLEGESKGFTMA